MLEASVFKNQFSFTIPWRLVFSFYLTFLKLKDILLKTIYRTNRCHLFLSFNFLLIFRHLSATFVFRCFQSLSCSTEYFSSSFCDLYNLVLKMISIYDKSCGNLFSSIFISTIIISTRIFFQSFIDFCINLPCLSFSNKDFEKKNYKFL